VMKLKVLPVGYQFCKIDLKDIKDSYIIFIPKTK
jgi:16S rRNA (guanine527-N7)-methyltransferase